MRIGEVWTVDLPYSGGHEQAGRRPAIVVQATPIDSSPLITVVPLSSRLASSRFSATTIVDPDETNGLSLRSVELVFQVRSLDRTRFMGRLGIISEHDSASLRAELRSHFGL